VEVTLIYPTESAAFVEFTKASVQKLKVSGTVHTSAGDLQVEDVTDFPAPKLLQGKVSDAQMASIDDGAAGEVVLDLTLFNPNQFHVKADAWNMKITVADKELKEFDVGQGETIQPNAGVQYSETFKIDKENWGPDYKQVLKRSSVSYRVVGSIKVGEVSYPVEAKGEMKFHR
jgi:LEA14-like dessication related protein